MKVALFLAILFVVLCAFLAEGVERETQQNEKDIIIVPKKDYDVKDRRKKYGTSTILEDKLSKEDCEGMYKLREFMKPATTKLKIEFPVGVNLAEDANAQPPILVISGGKYETLIKNLVDGVTPNSADPNHWVLWYSPYRTERDTRKIYIVVHHKEAANYKAKFLAKVLEGNAKIRNSIRLVSCQINAAAEDDENKSKQYYGFGLNRYCGMALMAKKNVPKFWMADDNLLMLSKIEDKLTAIETKADTDNVAVVGFKSGKKGIVNQDFDPKLESMQAVLGNGETKPGNTAIDFENRGENDFLEQLYFFRTAKLDEGADNGNFRSFSPMFLSSKEDMTFSYNLFKNNIPVKFEKNAEIYKVNMQFTDFDNADVNKFKPDKKLLIDATLASKIEIQYAKDGLWGNFGKDVGIVGKVDIETDVALANVKPFENKHNAPIRKQITEGGNEAELKKQLQLENWVDTVSKTQEVILYKCAVAAFKNMPNVADFNPDKTYFQFPKNTVTIA